ncbi:RteC protein [Tenacibaculum adriaticum]|uniref:RteC protein n=1 Tax=Tenacibaculum adriaticum TaxID=413713 RepID=A0A5S5DYU5_9FLAO|nr:RteC domain-containing protein [Tenacibaculum adriaticum]TYQ00207.1 RteC protein [Tenacibaculum adriaticum]
MELKKEIEELLRELEYIHQSDAQILKKNCLSIISCRNLLTKFRKKVFKTGFNSVKEEIDFFKRVKQVPLSKLIYYKEIYEFETFLPKESNDKQKEFIKKQLKRYDDFFLTNIDFGQYMQMNHTHFDEYYFTRKPNKDFPIIGFGFFSENIEFNTPKDVTLAQFKAYDLAVKYLKRELKMLSERKRGLTSINEENDLFWTGSYASFVEMTYGIHAMGCLNNGNIDIRKIIDQLGMFLQITGGNYSRTYNELKSRKGSQIKFFEEAGKKLKQKMDDEDGLDS